eukprot:CAMPEP_0119398950 /NCGR_PEP_ID=MMETSP1334-20130426/141110_1 /TAXON_ID=127549 /ORGANISM="Calcidiscus leptoporus, Strain RCC1130" /LENGTH=90 /DNA_ID=CAMNT_0007422833 /DNA_START=786 /DNA_END=1058 /DNA_ORIENTATION=+
MRLPRVLRLLEQRLQVGRWRALLAAQVESQCRALVRQRRVHDGGDVATRHNGRRRREEPVVLADEQRALVRWRREQAARFHNCKRHAGGA